MLLQSGGWSSFIWLVIIFLGWLTTVTVLQIRQLQNGSVTCSKPYYQQVVELVDKSRPVSRSHRLNPHITGEQSHSTNSEGGLKMLFLVCIQFLSFMSMSLPNPQCSFKSLSSSSLNYQGCLSKFRMFCPPSPLVPMCP